MHEIANRHGRAYNTLRNQWARHKDWPAPVGKRGRRLTYDSAAVDEVIAKHFGRPDVTLDPHRLYTAREIAEATGMRPGTIRADLTRGRWSEPDDTTGGVNRWYGKTATKALTARRGYRRAS
ncbi:hypothetical protein AB0I84_12945 [Streptomyces spectabilis]|uniref:hypothetical protein n=1 Tax=Streptomyces spectabilis TaxID=68270 RepID=UPI00340EF13D